MNTAFMLMAQYECAIIPAREVAKLFDMTEPTLLRQISEGKIPLPLVRMTDSRECAKGVHVSDLAEYIDARRKAAQKEARSLQS